MIRGPGAQSGGGLELVWPGKYDAAGQRVAVPRVHPTLQTDFVVGADPEQQLGCFGGDEATPPPDRLIVADNLLAMDALQTESTPVDLIVADPPFSTGTRFDVVTRVGEGATRQEIRSPAYSDRWHGGAAGLIAMLDPRLRLAHALLAPHGSLYMHVDPTVGHAVKLLLDEIFGPGCFQREIVWRIGWVSGFKTKARNWIRNHDLIFFYVKDPKRFTFNKLYVPYPPGYTRRDGSPPTGKGVPLDDVWNGNDVEHGLRGADSMDSIQIKSFSREKTGYATQKNESLLRRIVAASSNEGDLVLDPFCGSGTTLAVARALGRRFIGIDTSRSAAQISLRRMVGAPGAGLAVQSLRTTERQALRAAGHDWAQFAGVQPEAGDGEPTQAGSAVQRLGRRDDVAVSVRADGVATDADCLHVEAAADGAAELIAWSWRLSVPTVADDSADETRPTALPSVFGGRTVAKAIERDVVGPNPMPGQGLLPLACPRVRVQRLSRELLRVELCGLTEGWPAALPARAAEVAASGLDLVDGWALDVQEGAKLPAEFSFASFRHHHRRTLVATADVAWGAGPRGTLRVRTWDVLQRTADLVLEIEVGDETAAQAPTAVRVVRAELQVGDGAELGMG